MVERTRADILKLLSEMGVALPPHSKLPLSILESRLATALSYAQCDAIPPSSSSQSSATTCTIDPATLEPWSSVSDVPLSEATRTWNLEEIAKARMSGQRVMPLYQNAFLDLRQTVGNIGHNWDQGSKLCVVEDGEGVYGFSMRIIDVLALDNSPIFVFLYEHGPGLTLERPRSSRFLKAQAGKGVPRITATLLEQKLLLKLLEMNGGSIAKSYLPHRHSTESEYQISFLAPLSPLNTIAICKLTTEKGCVVCGGDGKSRCARCGTVSYCSKDCQKADWRCHKPVCASVAGGQWLSVRFAAPDGRYLVTLNRFSTRSDISSGRVMKECKVDDTGEYAPPPNVYGNAPFLVKIQLDLVLGIQMLVYDRQRSFEVFVKVLENSGTFAQIADEIAAGSHGSKIYRWARRTGEWTLDICLGREPTEEIKW